MQQPDDKNINDDDLEDLYNWVDEVPLSRQKKSISRDFADGGESTSKEEQSSLSNCGAMRIWSIVL